jgi:hypothetical protein
MEKLYYPDLDNIGRKCKFWGIGKTALTCAFPKAELYGRHDCQGTIDAVCLYLRNGDWLDGLTIQQIDDASQRAPVGQSDA